MKISPFFILFFAFSVFQSSCNPLYPVGSFQPNGSDSQYNQNKNSTYTDSNRPDTGKQGQGHAEDRSLPPGLTQAMKDAGFLYLYEGSTPPNIEGEYHVVGKITASNHCRAVGSSILSGAILSNQLSNLSISIEIPSTHKGQGWITGQNNTFTMYIYGDTFEKDCPFFNIISGIKKEKELHVESFLFYPTPSKTCCRSRSPAWEKQIEVWRLVEKKPPPPIESTEEPNNPHNPPPLPPPPPFP